MTTETEINSNNTYDESDEEIINTIDINGSLYDLPGLENFETNVLKLDSIEFASKASELVVEYVKSETLRSSSHMDMKDESVIDRDRFSSSHKTKKNGFFSSKFFKSGRKKKNRTSSKFNSCDSTDINSLNNSNDSNLCKPNTKETDSQNSSNAKPLNSFFNREWLNTLGDGIKKKASVMSELRKAFRHGIFGSKKKVNISSSKSQGAFDEARDTKKALKVAKTLKEDTAHIYDSDATDDAVEELYADEEDDIDVQEIYNEEDDVDEEINRATKLSHKTSLGERIAAEKSKRMKYMRRNIRRMVGLNNTNTKTLKAGEKGEAKVEEVYADEVNMEKIYDDDIEVENEDEETVEENERISKKNYRIKGSLIKIGLARLQKTSMSIDKNPIQFFAGEVVALIDCKKNDADTVLIRNSLGRCGLIMRDRLIVNLPN